ncbi:MAG: ankyrin repeat domain-containing protein [Bacteroidales bacterium]|nr:ankyrin repeat domain-containing protein [Bacteroidales bacterium]
MKKLTITLILTLQFVFAVFAQQDVLTNDLFSAFQSNDLEEVKRLIEQGADVNGVYYQKKTPLHFACQKDSTNEIIKLLINKGADINARNSSGNSPLIEACKKYGNLNAAILLIEKGADINIKDYGDNTALHIACESEKNINLLKLLIEKEADINAKNKKGETPLIIECRKDNSFNTVKFFVEKGALINVISENGDSPLILAFEKDKSLKTAKFLIENDADINLKDNQGNTPLIIECRKDNSFNTVRFLVEKGALINVISENGDSPLILACENDKSLTTAKFLIENDADINVTGGYSNNSVLHLCCENENGFKMAKQLIEKGININVKNNIGETPLFSAVLNKKSFEFAKLLIDNGANVSVKTTDGYNPLHWVIFYKTAKLLLEKGVDVNAKSSENITPLHSACSNGAEFEVIKLFIEHGADLNVPDRIGDTPLLTAFRSEHYSPEIIKLLIEAGADVTKKNNDNYTALHFCTNVNTAKLLIEKGADVNARDIHGRPPIHDCSFEMAKLLLDNGAVIKDDLELSNELLYYPLRNNEIELVKLLLESGADVNAEIDGYKLFTYAIKKEYYEIAELLIENGAETNPEYFRNYTPISYAVINNNFYMCKILIEKGADVNVFNKDDTTPLSIAVKNKFTETARLLIENGADVNYIYKKNFTLLCFSLEEDYFDLIELLIETGIDVNIPVTESYGLYAYTALHFAVEKNYYDCTALLLKKGSDINAKDSKGFTPLSIAVRNNNLELVNLLIDHKADIQIKSSEYVFTDSSYPILHYAIENNNYKLAELLIKEGADINQKVQERDKEFPGYTPLHFAARHENAYETVKLIIKSGADLNVKDKNGYTPLHVAAQHNNLEPAFLLYESGADINIEEVNGHNAKTIADNFGSGEVSLFLKDPEKFKIFPLYKLNRFKELNKLLKKDTELLSLINAEGQSVLHQAILDDNKDFFNKNVKLGNINIRNFKRESLLFYALLSGKPDYAELLIENGADVNLADIKGNTPLYLAKSKKYDQIVSLLKIKGAKEKNIKPNMVLPLGHTDIVNSVCYSPDGNYLLSGSSDESIKLWKAESGKEIKTFKGHNSPVNVVSFSPDGKYILSGANNGEIKLWDIRSGNEITRFKGHSDKITSISFSPNGESFVSGSEDQNIIVWDIATGKQKKKITEHKCKIASVNFITNNTFLSAGYTDQKIILWDLTNGEIIRYYKGHIHQVSSLSIGPNKKRFISTTYSNKAWLWDIETGNIIKTYKGHWEINDVAYSPDGKHFITGTPYFDSSGVTTGHACITKLWDIETGNILNIFDSWSVESLAFSPDGKKFVTGLSLIDIKEWDVENYKEVKTFSGHGNEIKSVDSDLNGSFFIVGDIGEILDFGYRENIERIWELSLNNRIKILSKEEYNEIKSESIENILTSDKKYLEYRIEDHKIILYDSRNNHILKTLAGHTEEISNVAFDTAKDYIVSGSDDNTMKLWNVSSGKLEHNFKNFTNGVSFVNFNKDGRFIFSVSKDYTAKIWSAKTNEELATIMIVDSVDWIIHSPGGLFDASPGAMSKMHYVIGLDIVELNQLKDRYYEPGLLRKILKGEDLRDVQGLNDIKLPPEIELSPILNGKTDIKIYNKQNGGIGRIQVFINGKEIISDARRYSSNYKTENDLNKIQEKDSIQLSVDITGFERYFLPNEENIISVRAYNGENYIISRPVIISYTPEKKDLYNKDLIPDVYILSIGVSDYYNDDLNLRFAAKDARDIATGLQIAANRLFGEDKVHTYLFTSPLSNEMKMINGEVTISNFNKVFEQIGYDVTADDIVIVYLAGHGMNIDSEGDGGDFYYLTQDAHSNEFSAYSDQSIREKETLAGSDIIKLMNKLPANKQVLIIDACHSGKAVENLMASRDMSSSTIRALDRMRDRTGMHIITGSTADAVSYESNQFGQGILTYSLLEGLKGASLKEGKFVDVMLWFQRAKNRVPDLASGLGGIQDPVIFSPYVEGKYKEGAESFEIGELNSDDKKLIPLADSKPIFVLSLFNDADNFDDHLEISEKVDEKLRDLTAKGSDAPLILLETRNFPSAYKLRGQYKVTGDKINLKVNLFKGKDIIQSFEFTGNKNEINIINQKIINEILSMKI